MKIRLPEFSNKSELFNYLASNKEDIIELKKSELKECDSFSGLYTDSTVSKAADSSAVSKDTNTEINRTIVGNTYYWMDSHEDVHVTNCFGNSIKQRGVSKIQHLHDHVHQLDARVGKFSDVYEKQVPWTLLGVQKEGTTEALLGDTTIKRSLNKTIFDQYKDGEIDQHSVGMFYVTVKLAMNDPNHKEAYAEWLKVYPLLGNPEKAQQNGFFWIVYEAKLREISCVIAGSNEITPTLEQQTKDGPPVSTQTIKETEPPADSSTEVKSDYFYQL